MLDEHNRIIASVNYLANYLSDLHYKYDIINSEGKGGLFGIDRKE